MKVEIWSDVICPWCYIGKRRFEQALALYDGRDDVEVEWKSFELDPTAGAEPQPLADRLAHKFNVSHDEAVAMNERMTETAAGVGLQFRLDVAQSGNTLDAHRLIHLAAAHGLQGAMKEQLMEGYFSEGRAISDRDALVEIAVRAGLDGDEARAMLESDRFTAEVRADEQLAAGFGINGVPFFVLDRRFGISGAQPVEVLVGALEEAAAAESQPA
ncbi:MAG TPA: DsbA family oxidoreductase [Gaiellales bacterium]|jgi:predicted DsbA family dithiol-disulfide isomerase